MEIVEEKVAEVIAHNLKNPASLFVFPSDVACTSWTDWAIKAYNETHTRAFNLDQFAAWDTFKADFFKPDDEGLTCISSVLRKIFAEKLIAQNNEQHLFKKLIYAAEGMQDTSFGFTDWIAKILPSLKFWHERYQRFYLQEKTPDEEDEDYETLFELYTAFLHEGGFYEPAYVKERLKRTEREIFIFYPEIIDDFYEFEEILSGAKNVTLVKLPGYKDKPHCVFYEDARQELRFLALHLRKLQYENVDLRRVAVSVPDLDKVRAYLERELKTYAIPYVVRSGVPYSKNCAGEIFQKIKDCAATNFSYDSVRSLLLDGFIPWKNTDMNERLVRIGYERRCVCSFKEQDGKQSILRDVWLSSLDEGSAERGFYQKLRKMVQDFANAPTFKRLRIAWMSFQREFIDESKFSEEQFSLSNKMMGKILSELNELISIEEKYVRKINYKLRSPFDFFVSEIANKTYEPDEKKYGVNIFPYALAACADFDFQFVLDSSQGSLASQQKMLAFISDETKRCVLQIDKSGGDVANVFVNLYTLPQKNSFERYAYFSASKMSFEGFSIVHSSLEEVQPDEGEMSALEAFDFVSQEKCSLKGGILNEREISKAQKSAFLHWMKGAASEEESLMSQSLKDKIDFSLRNKGLKATDDSKVKISQTELNSFFFCPRKFVFKNVLTLQEDTLDVDLTKNYEIGNLLHKMIELVCQRFKAQSGSRVLVFPDAVDFDGLYHLADEVFEEAKLKTSFAKSSLALQAIESQKRIVCQTFALFLKQFCSRIDGAKYCGFGGFYIDDVELEKQRENESGLFDYFGRIDCVLEDPDSSENKIVVDYKTGTLPNIKDCIVNENGNLNDFQMACYVKLLEEDEAKVSQALFYGMKKKADGTFETNEVIVKGKKKSKGKHERDDFDATLAELERCAQYFFEKCQVSDFKPLAFKNDGGESEKYGIKVFEKCTSCAFSSICRTPFNVAKRTLN